MNTFLNLEVVTLFIIITIQERNTKYLINLVKHRIFKLNDVFSEWVNCSTLKSFVDFPITYIQYTLVYTLGICHTNVVETIPCHRKCSLHCYALVSGIDFDIHYKLEVMWVFCA